MADVQIVVEAVDKASATLAKVQGELNTTQTKLTTGAKGLQTAILGQVAAYASLTAVMATAIKLTRDMINFAAEEETSFVRLGATIKSMGLAGVESASGIRRMAESIMKVTNVAHEELEGAAQVFMRMDSFDPSNLEKMLKITADFAAGTGQNAATAAQQIATALETGQTRSLHFSKALREQITEMINAGDSAGSLALIMDTLNEKYGGQAAAQMDTYAGKVKGLQIAWEEFLAGVGSSLLPGGKSVIDFATNWVQSMTAVANRGGEAFKALTQYHFREAAQIAAAALGEVGLDARNIDMTTRSLSYTGSYSLQSYNSFGGSAARDYSATMQKMASANSAAQKNLADYWDEVHKAQQDAIDQQEKLNEEIQKTHDAAMQMETGFETAFSSAKTGEDKVNAVMELIGNQIQAIPGMGQDVWNEFLVQMKKISPAAIEEFAKVQTVINNLRNNLAAGMDLKIAVQMAIGEARGLGVLPAETTTTPSGYQYMGTVSASDRRQYYWNSTTQSAHIGTETGWANGGSFYVPPGYPNDSYRARFSSGEFVTVTPPGAKSGGGTTIIINGYTGDLQQLAREVDRRQNLQRLMQ